MNRNFVFLVIGLVFGNKSVPMIIHWAYIALAVVAYKYGQAHA
jgi:hypothetical protein